MKKGIRIVAPYRPFPPEAIHHQELAAFDWVEAIRMMMHSAEIACHCPVHVITDVDTELPVPCLKYQTTQRRLMLWNLEVCASYLASDDFDRDTVMVDSDQLIYRDLTPWFGRGVDLGLLLRTQFPKGDAMALPILNGVQFWSVRGRDRLVAFYRQALDVALALPEDLLVWGADTVALARLLAPLEVGVQQRGDLTVSMIDSNRVLIALSATHMRWLEAGRFQRFMQTQAVLDFRAYRKSYMKAAYDATVASEVPA